MDTPTSPRALPSVPDGRTLASSSYDGTVRLWEVSSGQMIRVLAEHTNWVTYVTFSPDGRLLASSSTDETIRLWDPDTGECLQTWRIPGPYDGMNITGVTGITDAQCEALRALGAVETTSPPGGQVMVKSGVCVISRISAVRLDQCC